MVMEDGSYLRLNFSRLYVILLLSFKSQPASSVSWLFYFPDLHKQQHCKFYSKFMSQCDGFFDYKDTFFCKSIIRFTLNLYDSELHSSSPTKVLIN